LYEWMSEYEQSLLGNLVSFYECYGVWPDSLPV
jgi:hypothetical protein